MTDSDKPTIADAMKNFLAVRLANGLTEDEPAEQNAPHLARAVLLAVNATEVPAGTSQRAAWDAAAAGGSRPKSSRLFGRSLLALDGFFAAVRAKALADGAALAGLEQFLDAFHSSFKDGVVSEEEVDLGKLVWAEDFNAVLHQRGLDRAARAAEAAAADADGGGSGDGALEGMLRAGFAGESS